MGRRCCVCKIYAVPGSGISFHSFPLIDSYRKQWIDAIPIRININNLNLLICSQHFHESDFKFGRFGKRYLPKRAIPSIFENLTSDVIVMEDVDNSIEVMLEDNQLFTSTESQDFITFENPICDGTSTILTIQTDPTNNIINSKSYETNITNKCLQNSKKKYRVSKWEKYFNQCNEALIRSTHFHDYLGKSLLPCKYELISTAPNIENEQIDSTIEYEIESDKNFDIINSLETSEIYKGSDTESAPEKEKNVPSPKKLPSKVTKQRIKNFTPKHYDKLKRQLTMAKNVISQKKKQIKILQQSKRRLQKKMSSMNNVINELKAGKIISEHSDLGLLSPSSNEVVKRFLQGNNSAKYSPELKKFAVTLFFYSRKAYEYVRSVFNDSLPHPRTIAKWFEKDNELGVNVEPLQSLVESNDDEQVM